MSDTEDNDNNSITSTIPNDIATQLLTPDTINEYIKAKGIESLPKALTHLDYLIENGDTSKDQLAAIEKVLQNAGHISEAEKYKNNTHVREAFRFGAELSASLINSLSTLTGNEVKIEKIVSEEISDTEEIQTKPHVKPENHHNKSASLKNKINYKELA